MSHTSSPGRKASRENQITCFSRLLHAKPIGLPKNYSVKAGKKNADFVVGSAGNNTNSATNFSSATYGRVTQAYQDLSTTNDPGGRLIQLVLRINF